MDDSPLTDGRLQRLSDKQRMDFESLVRDFREWSTRKGKRPKYGDGYAETTVDNRLYRLHDFFEFVFGEEHGYTTRFTHDHADAFMDELAYEDRSNYDKGNHEKAVKMWYKWLSATRGKDPWTPEMTFNTSGSSTVKRDFLSKEEREQIREAALSLDNLPHYNSVTPEERDRINRYLAQRLGIPKANISPEDWDHIDGFKIPSLVFTSLDCALRPIEVERATVEWVDTRKNTLFVPKQGSRKDEDDWEVAITNRTSNLLESWLQQRQTMEKYDDTDTLWLTSYGNPYQSNSLSSLLERLFEEAGIETRNRQVSWYTLRRSTGTHLIEDADMAVAKNQLRHKQLSTTERYDQNASNRARDSLEGL